MAQPQMEEIKKEQQPAPTTVPGKSKLRYPLRSAAKLKEEKQPAADLPSSSASKRARPLSTVSKSVSVLDLSGKDKPARPPRRLSIPAKSNASVLTKPAGNITPISEVRAKRATNGQSETPLSTVSSAASRKKFPSMLSSASYWLRQIKLSESAAKHSISLGFFKLALEAGCEPLQQMRDELKSYVRRHELSEYGESVKELFESYSISDNQEQVQVSEICSQMPEEGTRSSDDEVHSSSSMIRTRKLRPRSLNADAVHVSSAKESAKKDTATTRTRGTLSKNTTNSVSVSANLNQKVQKKTQKPIKQEATKEKEKIKQAKKSPTKEDTEKASLSVVTPQENKENMDAAPAMEEVNSIEVI